MNKFPYPFPACYEGVLHEATNSAAGLRPVDSLCLLIISTSGQTRRQGRAQAQGIIIGGQVPNVLCCFSIKDPDVPKYMSG
jgi:hypothetical protein